MARFFHLSCTAEADLLYELSDGSFQLISGGPVAPLMIGFGYVLAEQALAEYIDSLEIDHFSLQPAIILRRPDIEITTHRRLFVGQQFTPDMVRDMPLSGRRIMLLNNQYLFVTPEAKAVLDLSAWPSLKVTDEFTDFADP
jgi:hypothetical protein